MVCEFVPQEKRDYCLKELVETEAKYLEVLNMLKKHFINSPRLNPLKENDRAAIFMNIPQLIDLHQLFHSQIVDYVSKHIQGQRKVPLGAIFLEQKKQFLIYSHYCCALPKGKKPVTFIPYTNVNVRSIFSKVYLLSGKNFSCVKMTSHLNEFP